MLVIELRGVVIVLLVLLATSWAPAGSALLEARCGHGCATGTCRCDEAGHSPSQGAHCSKTGAGKCLLSEAADHGDKPVEKSTDGRDTTRCGLLPVRLWWHELDLLERMLEAEKAVTLAFAPRPPNPPPRSAQLA
jgi:hypothetical protein